MIAIRPLLKILLQRQEHVIGIKGTRLVQILFIKYIPLPHDLPSLYGGVVMVFHKVLHFWTNLLTLCMLLL